MTVPQPAPVRSRSGRLLVPGNRWDLVAATGRDATACTVAVVVVHRDDPRGLRRLLDALAAQTCPADEVIVVDDGSRHVPAGQVVAEGEAVVLTGPDLAGHVAAARNRGAALATADVVVLLDTDLVPHPGTLAAITALPARLPDALVVGRVVTADVDGLAHDQALAAAMDPRSPRRGPDQIPPAPEAARTRQLRDLDVGAWRLAASPVVAVDRRTLLAWGGIAPGAPDERSARLELAHRALHAGAVLAHAPDAVVVRDARAGADAAAEDSWLLGRITDRTFRPSGPCWPTRRVVARLDDLGWTDQQVLACAASLLHVLGDVEVQLRGRGVAPGPLRADPRVVGGAAAGPRDHVEVELDVHVPILASAGLVDALAALDPGGADELLVRDGRVRLVTATAARTVARIERAAEDAEERADLWSRLATTISRTGPGTGITPLGAAATEVAHNT